MDPAATTGARKDFIPTDPAHRRPSLTEPERIRFWRALIYRGRHPLSPAGNGIEPIFSSIPLY
jgi:hypothetical protein